jgi:pimeloyl-ACP methyl ester carboxylesterase
MITDPTQVRPSAANTGTLDVPGARLHYEVRGAGPLAVLVGAPMDAVAFAPLADQLAADHTVLTTDPRGINRSSVDDRDQDSTPQLRAADLAHLITHLDAGPAAVVGSSGGAVSTLALVQARPDLVRTAIVHEPPLVLLLDDREEIRAKTEDYVATYLAGDVTGAWRKFFAAADIAIPDAVLEHMVGGDRDPRIVADERFWFEHEMRGSDYWEPDFTVLAASPSRIVVGVGEQSAGQLCARTSAVLAGGLGTEPVVFPGDHTGFVGDPEGFAARLRPLLG